jgi:hypothetical protein
VKHYVVASRRQGRLFNQRLLDLDPEEPSREPGRFRVGLDRRDPIPTGFRQGEEPPGTAAYLEQPSRGLELRDPVQPHLGRKRIVGVEVLIPGWIHRTRRREWIDVHDPAGAGSTVVATFRNDDWAVSCTAEQARPSLDDMLNSGNHFQG